MDAAVVRAMKVKVCHGQCSVMATRCPEQRAEIDEKRGIPDVAGETDSVVAPVSGRCKAQRTTANVVVPTQRFAG